MRDSASPPLILQSRSTDDTERIAAALGGVAEAGDCLALSGPLGAGKTFFVAAFCEALGVPREQVDSPSFVLLNEYAGRLPVYHFDAYRLDGGEEELAEAGFFDERLVGGVCLVEWAERLEPFLPAGVLRIAIAITGESARCIEIAEPPERVRGALRAP